MTLSGEEIQWPSNLWTWIQIAGFVVGIIGFFIMLGMTLGPLKDVVTRVKIMEDKISQNEYSIKDLQARTTATGERMNGSETDRRDIHAKLTLVAQKAESDVTKLEFVEWIRVFERQNKTIYAPPLKPRSE